MPEDYKIEDKIEFKNINNKDGFYVTHVLPGTTAQTAANYGIFFTARHPCEVLWVGVRYAVAAGAALTLDVVKAETAIAVSAGNSLLATQIDLNTTADTVYNRRADDRTLVRTGYTQLKEGDSLGIKTTGTLGALSHLAITIYLKFTGKGNYR